MPRVVLLGASNLTRGFPAVLDVCRRRLGAAPLEILAAAGHGRSFGRWSRVFHRGLPGIVDSGLWNRLATPGAAPAPLRALITDVGNDLIYGARPEEIAGWVETCLARLEAAGAQTVLVRLPMASLERLGPWKFQLLRTLLYPPHPISFDTARRRARRLDEQLEELGGRFGIAMLRPAAEWYGPDHIHLRRRLRARVWTEVLSHWRPVRGDSPAAAPLSRGAWWAMAPERRTVFGVEVRHRQPAGRLSDGTRIWLF